MNQDAVEYLKEKIEEAIDYCRAEWNMNYAEAIGVLDIAKHRLLREAELTEEGCEDE